MPTSEIYRGVIPFIVIQLLALILITVFSGLATWLPEQIYG
jgi:TRAP-type mannitol/chloroaromatic compound transport system permease large subunit